MKNFKFVEFITKYEKFYNLLSEQNKEMISDLDEYNMDLYLLRKDEFINTKEADVEFEYNNYIYLGKKNNILYFYKIFQNFKDNDYKNLYISNGYLVIFNKCLQLKEYNLK